MAELNSTISLTLNQVKKFSHAFSTQYDLFDDLVKPTYLLYSLDTGLTLYREFSIWNPIHVSDEEIAEIATLNLLSTEEAKRVFFKTLHRHLVKDY